MLRQQITLAVLLLGSLYLCFLLVRPFGASLLAGTAIAVFSYPLHQRIRRRIRNRTAAAVLSTAVVLIAFVGPVTALAIAVTRELGEVQATLAAGGAGLARLFGTSEARLRQFLEAHLQESSKALLSQSAAWIGAVAGGILKSVIVLVSLFFVLRDGDRLQRLVIAWSPLGEARTRSLLAAVHQSVIASFYGAGAVAAAQGLMCGVGVWIAGLASPLLWGIAASAASLVPLFGSALVWVPASLVLFAHGSAWRGVFMLAWGAGVVATIDNVVRPLVVTARLPINPLLMLVAILGGLKAFGIVGIFVGPAVLCFTAAVLRMVREEMRDSPRVPAGTR